MRILIVEDDFVNRQLLTKLLAPFGQSDVAINGQEAIDAFNLANQNEQPYDLVCLDIMMPVKDGYETLEEIRQIEDKLGIKGLDGVKIIMTTAVDTKESIMKSFRDGCESYLVKPIGKPSLYNEMEKLGLTEMGSAV